MTLPAEDCLDYDPDECRGLVELWTTGRATSAWPRCTFHRDKRWDSYEHSDVAPDWFDPAAIGERWEDD